jgi:heme exporter protein CcmB
MVCVEWKAAIVRETSLLQLQVQQWALPLCFAVVMLVLFQFALDDAALLHNVLPRCYSIIALLVMFLIPDYLFKQDWLSGYLHQYALSPLGFNAAIYTRLCVQGLWMGVPLFLVLLLSVFVTGLPNTISLSLLASLGLLLPILFLLAAFSSALTLTLPQTSLLSVVILMPFYCPPLIIAQSMVMHAQMGLPFLSEIYLLCAIMIATCATLPWVIVFLLKKALG